MFSQLSDKLQDIFKELRGHGTISESNIDAALRHVRLALLEADVDFQVAKRFIARVREKSLGESGRVLIVGLNGSGKTTSSAKLARLLKKQGRAPVLVACDLQRPAAIEQLVTLGKQIDVPAFTPEPGENNVQRAATGGSARARLPGAPVIEIFDTAGRQEIDEVLIQELKRLKEFLNPEETLLVVDAATGQQAVSVASRFNDALSITGIILTKLDGDARGGAALSMHEVTRQPIKFTGTGEKLDQFEVFVPERLAGRILGMGDVVSLVEKAAEA